MPTGQPESHAAARAGQDGALRALLAAALVSGSFLLFLVQPLVAKQLLPWFGGAANVWTCCLVFFQFVLLLGYAFAHWLEHGTTARARTGVLVLAVALGCLSLPIVPAAHWKPVGIESPSWRVLGALAMTVGIPYGLLCATSPLVQSWSARRFPERSPYRLFALSNLASLLALFAYPAMLEPWTGVRLQSQLWSAGYLIWALLLCACAWMVRDARSFEVSSRAQSDGAAGAPPGGAQYLVWVGLAALGSVLLVTITRHITRDVAAVPLLWVVPLALYLGTFIVSFQDSRWISAGRLTALGIAALALYSGYILYSLGPRPNQTLPIAIQIAVYCGVLVAGCLACHGRLALTRPAPRYLTRFYITLAAGGALGSALTGIAAPALLSVDFDLEIAMVALGLGVLLHARGGILSVGFLASAAAYVATLCAAGVVVHRFGDTALVAARNFYGTLRVSQRSSAGQGPGRSLANGITLHGAQYLRSPARLRPTTYYGERTGIGLAIKALRSADAPLRIGVIGLGVGTLAAYGNTGDVIRFYELNPAVIEIARRDFSYLRESAARVQVVPGDARLSLEREPAQGFDLLAIDAFSSDAIPVHLLTREALAVYLRHLKPGGVLAFHTSNRYLELPPVVARLAAEPGLIAQLVSSRVLDDFNLPASWVLVSSRPEFFRLAPLDQAASPLPPTTAPVWTDDFSDLLRFVRFRR